MKYNKNRYFYLLEQEEFLKKQGRSLYKENREDYLELLNYQVQLEDHKYWENRQKYFSVISAFLNGIITAEDFSDEFLYLWKKDRDRDGTEITETNFEPKGFSRLIGKVFSNCEIFEPESKEDEEYNEKWLKKSIEKVFSEMQKFPEEEL